MRLKQTGPLDVNGSMNNVDLNIELDPGGGNIWYTEDGYEESTLLPIHPNDPGGTTDRYVTKNTYTPFGEPATPGDTSWRTFVLLSSIGTILDVTPKTGWSSYPGGKLLPDDIQWGPYDNVSPEKPTIG